MDYLITYDLNRETNRASREAVLFAAFKLVDQHAVRLGTTTTWLLSSPMELAQVDRTIRTALDRNDEIIIAKVAGISPRSGDLRARASKLEPPFRLS